MIYLDVSIPSISEKVEIRTDEENSVGKFKEEICLLLQKKLGENESCIPGFELYDDVRKEILPDDMTLSECGISGGNRVAFL